MDQLLVSTVVFCLTINTIMDVTGGGVDYTSGPYTVTFPARQTTATFEVPITDDNTFEGNETFMLTIDSSSLPTGLTSADPDEATVTIFEEGKQFCALLLYYSIIVSFTT